MKRKIAIYLVLLATILGAVPYLTGMLVEAKFHDVVNLVSQMDSLPVTVRLLEYKRGWRSAFAKTEIVIYRDAGKKQYRFILNHDIRHGPFVQRQDKNYRDWEFARALIHSSLQLTQEGEKILLAELGQTALFNLNSEFAIDGGVRVLIQGPELKLKEHEGTNRVAFKGIAGVWTISSDMKEINGQMELPGIDIDLNGAHLVSGYFTYTTHLKASPEGLWPGEFAFKMDKLNFVTDSGKMNLSIDGFTSKGVIAVQGALVDLYGTCHADKMILNDKEYGPIEYSNALRHLDAQLFKTFLAINHQIKIGNQDARSKMFQFLLNILPDVLKTRPEFTIDKFHVHSQEGDLNAQLYLAIGGLEANNISNMPQVIRSIVSRADIVIPKTMLKDWVTFRYLQENTTPPPVVDQPEVTPPSLQESKAQAELNADQAISKWLQDSTLIPKDQYYLLSAEFKDGKFSVNGHQVLLPVPQMR